MYRFDTKARVNERVTEPGDSRAEQRERGPRRQPDKRLAGGFNQHADQRNSCSADPVRQMAKEQASRDKGNAQKSESKPCLAPPVLSTEHVGECSPGMGGRRDGTPRYDEEQCNQWDQRRR